MLPDRREAGRASLLVALVLGLFLALAGVVLAVPAGAGEVAGEEPSDEPTANATAVPSDEPAHEPTPPETPTSTTTPTVSPIPTEGTDQAEVSGAVFRWGVSDQTNARSHNPVAINFLAAGVANPGRGGVTLKQSQWSAVQGNVEIQKATNSGGWQRATWRGLETSPAGERIGTEGPFSGHTVVIRNGSGTVDRASGDARVAWKGTFTVVYYGGNTVFTVTDPVLVVRDGVGRVNATLGGFLAERDDPTAWSPATPKRVRVATISSVDLGRRGTILQPDYDGVRVTGSQPQDRSGAHAGAFPQPFVSYLVPLGTDQFWYSTGLSTDHTKRPAPMHVSWTADEIDGGTPTPSPTATPDPTNPVATPPPGTVVPPVLAPGAPVAPVAAPPAVPGARPPGATAGSGPASLPASSQLVAAARGPVAAGDTTGGGSPWWWVGGACLLLAAVATAVPPGRRLPSPPTA